MPLARVVQGRISTKDPDSRIPVAHYQGEAVELSDDDFARLSAAGAVRAWDDDDPTVAPEASSEPAGVEAVEDGQSADALKKLTHDELDELAAKAELAFSSPKATKAAKAAELAAHYAAQGE